jgi:isopentenyl diphosphate isomerase/L-lactate dehydrogenase-like FMN-dependent dehydrogenase
MDRVPATLEVLPGVVDAVGDRLEVLVDPGIRRGGDIVTALSTGRRALPVGMAHLYSFAAAGEAAVRRALDVLRGLSAARTARARAA